MTKTKSPRKVGKKLDMQKLLAPVVLVLLYVVFAFIGNNFFTLDTFKNILEQSYYIGFMAFGVTFVIITGGIDLSLGTVMMCAALLGGYTFNHGWPLLLSLALVLFVGLAFGLVNGVLIAKVKLPPFIATLGTQMMSMGLGSILTKTQSQTWPTATAEVGAWFKKVFIRVDINIKGFPADTKIGEWCMKVFDRTDLVIKGFPVGAVWLFVFFAIAALILHKTKFGRYMYAIGSNEEAARLSGINTSNWKVATYVLNGLFIGLAGIMYAGAYTTITPGTGTGLEMNGITGVIIGGTSMAGGSGSMVGTLIGVFIMSVLKTGLSACGLQAPWQTFLTGAVVIGAVVLDNYRTSAAAKAKKG